MWAVYFCGPTDCFLKAMFITRASAYEWARTRGKEHYITYWDKPSDIDTTDTGWH